MALIEIQGLTKTYGRVEALRGLDLTVNAGQIIGIFGPNGSGKSTLLKILAGIITLYEGKVLIGGARPAAATTKENISYLAEQPFLPDRYNARDCLKLYEAFFTDFDATKAESYIERFNLPMKTPMRKLSKGMQEKLHLAMIMGREAEVYLLDEPMGGIDPLARQNILDEMVEFYRPDAAVILTSHLLDELERVVDTAIFLKEGEIILAGGAEDLRMAHGKSLSELFREVCR